MRSGLEGRRRGTTAVLLASGVFALGAWACGGDETGGISGAAAADPFCQQVLPAVDSFLAGFEDPEGERYGGTVVVASIGEIPEGMNALTSSDYQANQHQVYLNLMTLVRFDANLEPRPYLAESWEFDEEEGTLTFHLRDDVFWHDGVKTTAEDVAFTYERATNPETGFPNSAFWAFYEPGEAGVEVVDSFTVRLRLRPHAEYLDSWRATAIMPAHLLGEVPAAQLKGHPFGTLCPVGNGPFRFVSHRQGESWTFAANPAFSEALGGRPYLDRYIYRVIPEQTTLLTELVTGSIDVFIGVRPDQADRISQAEGADLMTFQGRQYDFVGWNARKPQLSDARVRRAITLATNRREIVEQLRRGYGVVVNTGVPPFHWAYDPALADSLPYDPQRARALLDEAGWRDRDGDGIRENDEGTRLEISIKYNQGNQERQDVAEIMQAQLRQVGIAVRPQVVEWGTLLEQINEARDFEGVVMGWVNEFKVDDTDLFHSAKIDEPFAWAGTQDSALDHYLDTLQTVVDRAEARSLWAAYQQRLIEVEPYTFLFASQRLVGVSDRLRGVDMDARGELMTLRDWWIPAERRRGAGGGGR